MIRSKKVLLVFLFFRCVSFSSGQETSPTTYALTQDAQAVALAGATLSAMGGMQAIATYRDSVCSGTVTIYAGSTTVSYPITIKSMGLHATRVELQELKGTNIRIVNRGQGVIIRPNGTVKKLNSNNTFYEHVNHVPLLSLLAEQANGNVNLLYGGITQVLNQPDELLEIDFVPNLNSGATFASMSRTFFFVNEATHLVDKIQRFPFYEGGSSATFNEETYFSDYRQVSGMLVPYRVKVFIDGTLDTDLTLSSFELNVGLTDSDFVLSQAR